MLLTFITANRAVREIRMMCHCSMLSGNSLLQKANKNCKVLKSLILSIGHVNGARMFIYTWIINKCVAHFILKSFEFIIYLGVLSRASQLNVEKENVWKTVCWRLWWWLLFSALHFAVRLHLFLLSLSRKSHYAIAMFWIMFYVKLNSTLLSIFIFAFIIIAISIIRFKNTFNRLMLLTWV